MAALSRRRLAALLLASPLVIHSRAGWSDPGDPVVGRDVAFAQLKFPPFAALDAAQRFGYSAPSYEQKRNAQRILDTTPTGPSPYDIAKSFIDRFARTDPEVISQWPAPRAWNPIITQFFSATSLRVNNDMIDWCAAFVNWCLERNNKRGTKSASSQSFVTSGLYRRTDQPSAGDVAVFTCYNKQSGANLGLGHVAFFSSFAGSDRIRVLGGNQSSNGNSSIISERLYLAVPFDVIRHINGVAVPCIYRLNSFLVVD